MAVNLAPGLEDIDLRRLIFSQRQLQAQDTIGTAAVAPLEQHRQIVAGIGQPAAGL